MYYRFDDIYVALKFLISFVIMLNKNVLNMYFSVFFDKIIVYLKHSVKMYVYIINIKSWRSDQDKMADMTTCKETF